MRKTSIVIVAAFALLLGAAGQGLAGEGCTGTKAKTASAEKSGCTAHKGAKVETASASSGCAAHKGATASMTAEECAKLCGMTAEECAKICGGKENCGFTMIDVKGMTCGGCEKSIEAALMKIDGVNRVVKISHKEGVALVCTDTKKVESAQLTSAITDKGYEASIVPAVAKTTDAPAKKAAGCMPGCGVKGASAEKVKAGCATPCAGHTKAKKTSSAQ